MSKRIGLILFLLLAAVFLVLNRAAYQGYFADDDINTLAWTRWGSASEYLKGVLTPIDSQSYRAVGFYYFHVAGPAFGLDFPKYVASIHAIHLLDLWLLWLVMRRIGSPPLAAAAERLVGLIGDELATGACPPSLAAASTSSISGSSWP